MSKQAETRFKERVLRDLRQIPGCWCEKIQQRSIRGTLDIHVCLHGWFIALELKAEAGRVDKLQEYVRGKIAAAGGVALVVYPPDWPRVLEFLRKIQPKRTA